MASNESTPGTEVMSWPIPTIRLLGSREWVGAVIQSFHPVMKMLLQKKKKKGGGGEDCTPISESIKLVLRQDPIHQLLTELYSSLCYLGYIFLFPVQTLFLAIIFERQ